MRSSNVQNGEISKDDLVFIDSDVVNTNNVEIGDIIVVVRNGSRNLIGKHAQIKEKMTDTVIGAFMTGIRSKNSKFVNSLLNTRIFNDEINKNMGATINQITGYMFSNMEFKIPTNGEQSKIGELFTNLDNLITLHQRKFNYILSRKLEIKLFFFIITKNVWEQRKAKELCSITTGKSNTQDQVQDGKYPFYIRSDVPVRSNRYLYDEEAVITIGDGNIGRVFHYVNGKFDLHQRCYKMADFKALTAKYFYYYFSTKFYERAMSMTAKATVDSVRLEMISDMEIKFPKDTTEQTIISELLTNLDNLITLHQRKCTYIFYSWEQRELFDVADYRNGKAHENDIDIDGKYIVINSKFVSTEGKIKKYSNKQNEPLFQNEIAFVLSDVPNGRAIAKTFLVDKSSKYTLNQRIAGITPHSNINPKFLSITMNRNKYFLQFDDGVKQTNLSLNDMKKFEEFYPIKQEQDKIGDLFTNLDNLITLHQHKELKRRNDNNDNLRW